MTEAVRQAKFHYDHHDTYDKEQRINAVVALNEWRIYSNRQLSTFTGMSTADVGAYTGKTDKTGGNLSGESLGLVLELIHMDARGEVSYPLVAKAVDAGISTRMLAKLTGRSQRTVARHAELGRVAA
jgi:hypothetical protein